MKDEKNYMGFLMHKDIANFEAFCWNISLSATLLFLKSVLRPDPESISYFIQQDATLLLLLCIQTNSILCQSSVSYYYAVHRGTDQNIFLQ